jgi:hypothetical protein
MRRFRRENIQEFLVDENHPSLLEEWEAAKDHYGNDFEDFLFQMIDEADYGGEFTDWFEQVDGSIEFFEIQKRKVF